MGDGSKGAWFKDTEGNILGIMELSPADKKNMKQMMQKVGSGSSM